MISGYQIGLFTQVACIWEATARKPGNVHRFYDFADASYLDYLTSAASLGAVMAVAPEHPLGATICEAVRLRKGVTRANTNLGVALLLAPLAKAAGADLRDGVEQVLREADVNDSAMACWGICNAEPGGLGEVAEHDVRQEPTLPLRELMALAAERDLIARQYANGFTEVFDDGAPAILTGLEQTGSMEAAIILGHLRLMAKHPDSLIARKGGRAEAEEAAARAGRVLAADWPRRRVGWQALRELDEWLRAEGHQRNPGTTADLIAASLFVLLRTWKIRLPLSCPWAAPDADEPRPV
jgi:triphosphoribosyl-dephospho-CoA synthase